MGLSRSACYSALCSCLAHGLALGFAGTFIVSPPPSLSRVVKVTLVQPAVPLPVGEGGRPSGGTLTPPPEKAPALVPPGPGGPAAEPAARRHPTAQKGPRPTRGASPAG